MSVLKYMHNSTIAVSGDVNKFLDQFIGYYEFAKDLFFSKKVTEGVKSTLDDLKKMRAGELKEIGPKFSPGYISFMEKRDDMTFLVHYYIHRQIQPENMEELEKHNVQTYKTVAQDTCCIFSKFTPNQLKYLAADESDPLCGFAKGVLAMPEEITLESLID